MIMATWLIALTVGLPVLGALCTWTAGDHHPRVQHGLAVGFALTAAASAIALLPFTSSATALQLYIGGVFGTFTFVPDGLGVCLAIIATAVGSLAVIFSVDYMRGEKQVGRYYALVLTFIGAMAGLVLSANLLLLFIFWEITALCSYALISFHNDDPNAVAGGIKALILTQLGGLGLLVGILLIYAYLGSYAINTFLKEAPTLPPGVLNLIAFGFLAAAAAKSAQVPFHTWLPDAMEAPTPVSALIHAATMVNAGVYLLARFYPAFAPVPGWTTVVVAIGVVSALLASVMALLANDLKRVLAFSTISQLGYLVYAVGAGAVFASQFHLLSHAVYKALLFLAAGAVIHSLGTRDLRQMGGLGTRMPFVRNTFVIGALALIGLPFLNGFFSKELLLEEAGERGPQWATAAILVGTALTAAYTLRTVWLVFFGARRGLQPAHDATTAMRVSLTVLSVGALTTWLLAGPLSRLMKTSLPFHELNTEVTLGVVARLLSTPATCLTLGVIALGLAAWWWRGRLKWLTDPLAFIEALAADGFGFERVNRQVVRLAREVATLLRATQTGQLNWNMVGLVGGLLLVVAFVRWGGAQ
jgi:NADH-quinone oxidoreductase subunit L